MGGDEMRRTMEDMEDERRRASAATAEAEKLRRNNQDLQQKLQTFKTLASGSASAPAAALAALYCAWKFEDTYGRCRLTYQRPPFRVPASLPDIGALMCTHAAHTVNHTCTHAATPRIESTAPSLPTCARSLAVVHATHRPRLHFDCFLAL